MRESDEPKRPVTMRDVAKAAGVNASTVSRALRNDPNVSKKRREEIIALAEKIGYRPNPYVQAFTAHVRGYRRLPSHAPIAVLENRDASNSAYNELYIQGATQHAYAQGYKIELMNKESVKGSLERIKDILFARGIRALLVMPPDSKTEMPELADFPMAMATIDYSLKDPNLHRATPSYFQNMEIALRVCAQKGYKRMGFCTYRTEVDRIGMHWLGAFCGWRDLQNPENQVPVHYSPYSREDDETRSIETWASYRDQFYQWLDQEKPDLVISNNLFFYEWLRERGLRCPEDIGFVHLGLTPNESLTSGVDQNHQQIGAAAVDLLISQLQKNQQGIPASMQTVLIYGSWIEGGTTR
ncbi:LacI family DNA-binding transcriptional regulator [Kiritimatiellaeota bacterium B1221]|nr:LacI family DNA-binding transcriptional regulator [Kiritimatiellaeota bacterium B1221]